MSSVPGSRSRLLEAIDYLWLLSVILSRRSLRLTVPRRSRVVLRVSSRVQRGTWRADRGRATHKRGPSSLRSSGRHAFTMVPTRPGRPFAVRRTVLVYGLLGGVLIVALQLIQYRFLILGHSLEVYGGLVALIFAGLGIWLGLKMT